MILQQKVMPQKQAGSAAMVLIIALCLALSLLPTSTRAGFTHTNVKECISNSSAYIESLAQKGPVTSELLTQVLLGTFACAGVNADSTVGDRRRHEHSAGQRQDGALEDDTLDAARWGITPSPQLP